MTNAPFPPGSGGAPPTSSYPPGPSLSSMPRRSSYASVLSGAAAASPTSTGGGVNHPPAWSGHLSHLINSTPSSSYPPHHESDSRLHRFPSSELDIAMHSSLGGSLSSWRRGQLPSYSRQFASSPDYAGLSHPTSPSPSRPFFTPSYLRHSKYVARLQAAHKQKLAAQRETASSSTHSSNPASLSASSSNVNLHRMAPSHRGMTYDIIENHPSSDEEDLRPLPLRWNDADKYVGLDLLGDGLEVRYMGPVNKHDHDAASVRADHPMPPQCGIYYFEITILSKSKEGMIGIGFSNTKASLERLPGWEQESWAYHGDDGKTFFGENQGQGKPYGPTFTVNDTVGCGVNFSTGCAFFTKNGHFLGNAFREVRNTKLYPSVGMKKQPGAHVRVNFGQSPFIFDIDGMMTKEKMNIQAEIASTSTANLHPPLDETALIQELVAQFLAHDGYVETARAFAEEVRTESKALQSGQESPLKDYQAEEDMDAVNRQRIRAAILDGDIDKALKHTNAYYANVLQDNPQIYFRLRCRKFIEMMRRCTELQAASTAPKRKSANGSGHDPMDNDVFESEMELDEQHQDTVDWDGMDTEESDHSTRYQDLLQDAVMYGQELRMDYPDDPRGEYKRTLDSIFSLVAYDDPKSSVHGHLLDPSGRVPVAEELNSAILVSLGKSSCAALERLYQQTEVLVNEISEEGGAGAFINVRDDFVL